MTRIKRLEMKEKQKAEKEARDKKNKEDCIFIYEESIVETIGETAYKGGIPTAKYVQWLENYTDELFIRMRSAEEAEQKYYWECQELKSKTIPDVAKLKIQMKEIESYITRLERTECRN